MLPEMTRDKEWLRKVKPSKAWIKGIDKNTARIPEVVVYKGNDFDGEEYRTNLDVEFVGANWNDIIFSIVVVSGEWVFYKDANYGTQLFTLLPGYYNCSSLLQENGLFKTKGISSFKCINL